MITLHHLDNSRSQRILWLLEELGLEYEIKHYKRDRKTQLAPPELKQIHPLGKSPVITDGELVIAESGAIITYLLETYDTAGDLGPGQDAAFKREHTYWLHYAEGSLMPFMVMKLIFEKVESAPLPFFLKPVSKGISAQVHKMFISPNLLTHLEFVEAALGRSGHFVSDHLSGADIQMSFPLEAAASRLDIKRYPNIQAFLKMTQARAAYQRALERGGPYQIIS